MNNLKAVIIFSVLTFIFMCVNTTSVAAIGIIALLFQYFIHKSRIIELGFRKCRFSEIMVAITLPIILIGLILVLNLIFKLSEVQSIEKLESFLPEGTDRTVGSLIKIILLSAIFGFIVSMVTEELAFRGYIMQRLMYLGKLKALIISGLIFGIWHIPVDLIHFKEQVEVIIVYTVNISCLGIIFGWLFLRSKSLIPPAIAHGIWNALEYPLLGIGDKKGIFYGNKLLFDGEEGIAGTFVLFLTCFLLILYTHKKSESY